MDANLLSFSAAICLDSADVITARRWQFVWTARDRITGLQRFPRFRLFDAKMVAQHRLTPLSQSLPLYIDERL